MVMFLDLVVWSLRKTVGRAARAYLSLGNMGYTMGLLLVLGVDVSVWKCGIFAAGLQIYIIS